MRGRVRVGREGRLALQADVLLMPSILRKLNWFIVSRGISGAQDIIALSAEAGLATLVSLCENGSPCYAWE